MGYTAFSGSQDEVVTVEKWNTLGGNDDSFSTGRGIQNGVITSEHRKATIVCRVYRSAALTANTTGTKLLFDAKNFDTTDSFDLNTGAYIAPRTGYYQVNAQFQLANITDAGRAITGLYINGVQYQVTLQYSTATNADPRTTLRDLVPLVKGDNLYMIRQADTLEDVNPGSSATFMSIWYIGE